MFNVAFDPLRPWLRFQPPEEVPGFRLGVDDVPATVGSPPPGVQGHNPAAAEALSPVEVPPRAWWEPPPAVSNALDDESESHWPWLRAPTDEAPGFRLETDGSPRTESQASHIRLMSGALAPMEPQEQPDDVAGSDGMTSSDVVLSPQSARPSSVLATSIAAPASGSGAIDFGALAARAAALAPRVAPGVAGPIGALASLVFPTNTQSETAELGDGLRARVRPGQRTVEIERRVDNGLFGTGIGAKWETLPVEAWQHVGRDGSVNTVINHEQLNQALGRSAPLESKGTSASEMAPPPKDKTSEEPPPIGTPSTAGGVSEPDTANPPTAQDLAPSKIDVKALEEAKQRDPEEERVLACRAVREMPGQPAPPGQYSGPGGIDTAVGIRVAPGVPAPKGGYAYDPDYLRHWTGYKGELELKNRIQKAVPYEKIVHYGNPAGDQGPDVLTIGPDDHFMEWDSRSRMATRRVTPSMASKASLKYKLAHDYAWSAIRSRAVAPDAAVNALRELDDGNYNICTVGTGNAYDGYFESVRKGVPTGRRR